MTGKDAAKIGVTVVAAFIPPAISPDVLRWVRTTFHTVGIQDPMTEYGGDISFFLILTAFFLLPVILSCAFGFRGIPAWTAVFPWGLLISIWFASKSGIETTNTQFRIAYLGYFAAAIGLVGLRTSSSRWCHVVWIPPMLFSATFVTWPSWWNVFFE